MKKQLLSIQRFVLMMTLALLAGCGSASDESSDQAAELDSLRRTESQAPVDDLNSDQSELLDLALGNYEDGVVRGIAIGSDISAVKSAERFTLFEELPGSVGYSLDTDHLETIDVVYYYGSESKVKKIGIDIYLNSKASMDDLWAVSEIRFNRIYPEKHQVSDKVLQFKGKKGKVVIEKVVDTMDYGLKYSFEPANGDVALAALK